VLVPLLFETKSRDRYNEVWTIIVHKDVQMARLKLRDKLSDEDLRRRINAQLPQEKKAEWADVVIDNSSSPEVTRGYVLEKVQALYKRLGITPEPTPATVPATATVPPVRPKSEPGKRPPLPNKTDPGADTKAPVDTSTPAADNAPQSPDTSQTPAPAHQTPAADAPIDPAAEAERNRRYREALKQYGDVALTVALDKIGDVGTTPHKESSASMTMVVKAGEHDQSKCGNDRAADHPVSEERELQVDVHMSVRNKPGRVTDPTPDPNPAPGPKPDPTPSPSPSPSPSPTPNPAPGPTPTPVPNPTDPNSGKPGDSSNSGGPGKHCGHRHRGYLAFLAFLAFLLAALMIWFHQTPGKPVIIGQGCNSQCPPPIKPEPVKPTRPPVIAPLDPVVTTPVITPKPFSCNGTREELTEIPAFALSWTRTDARWRVAKWVISHEGSGDSEATCTHTTVTGYDSQNRLVLLQNYGDHLDYDSQYVVVYLQSGGTEVTLYDALMGFSGQTTYHTTIDGRLIDANRIDRKQRTQSGVLVQRNYDGSVYLRSRTDYNRLSGRWEPVEYFRSEGDFRDFFNNNFYLSSLLFPQR
jgi:hypothetical protein